jgi:hypothetical protein
MLVNGPDPDGLKAASIVARIRHWTRENLIAPAGVRNPGTGRHRRYSAEGVVNAALLNVLADNRQVIVGDMGYFLALTKARAAYVAWSADGGKAKPYFLELVSWRDKDGIMCRTVNCYRGHPINHDPTSAVSVIVNLSLIFKRLPALMEPDHGDEIATSEPES